MTGEKSAKYLVCKEPKKISPELFRDAELSGAFLFTFLGKLDSYQDKKAFFCTREAQLLRLPESGFDESPPSQ